MHSSFQPSHKCIFETCRRLDVSVPSVHHSKMDGLNCYISFSCFNHVVHTVLHILYELQMRTINVFVEQKREKICKDTSACLYSDMQQVLIMLFQPLHEWFVLFQTKKQVPSIFIIQQFIDGLTFSFFSFHFGAANGNKVNSFL